MAQVTVNIPDASVPAVRDGFCAATGYASMILNPAFDPAFPVSAENPELIPNPTTKLQWVKLQIINFILSKALEGDMHNFELKKLAERAAYEQARRDELAGIN